MKKIIYISILIGLSILLFSCGSGAGKERGKISVVATIFPEYDWAREIAGPENRGVEIKCLADNGADMHSYQPTVQDIMDISSADVFIYVGGESDDWVEEVLERAENRDMRVIRLLDVIGDRAREEEALEGMEDNEEEHGEEEEEEYDEHVWLSLKNAKLCCGRIADALSEADPGMKDTYIENLGKYTEKLDDLDRRFGEELEGDNKVLVFGDRFPFRYLADDYGLKCFAAFPGCSAETEASFETIRFLAEKVDEYGLGCILTLEDSDRKIAETIRKNTKTGDQEILTVYSMQSVTEKEGSEAAYTGFMEKNLKELKRALGNTGE